MLKALRLFSVLQTIDFEWHNPKEEETGGLW